MPFNNTEELITEFKNQFSVRYFIPVENIENTPLRPFYRRITVNEQTRDYGITTELNLLLNSTVTEQVPGVYLPYQHFAIDGAEAGKANIAARILGLLESLLTWRPQQTTQSSTSTNTSSSGLPLITTQDVPIDTESLHYAAAVMAIRRETRTINHILNNEYLLPTPNKISLQHYLQALQAFERHAVLGLTVHRNNGTSSTLLEVEREQIPSSSSNIGFPSLTLLDPRSTALRDESLKDLLVTFADEASAYLQQRGPISSESDVLVPGLEDGIPELSKAGITQTADHLITTLDTQAMQTKLIQLVRTLGFECLRQDIDAMQLPKAYKLFEHAVTAFEQHNRDFEIHPNENIHIFVQFVRAAYHLHQPARAYLAGLKYLDSGRSANAHAFELVLTTCIQTLSSSELTTQEIQKQYVNIIATAITQMLRILDDRVNQDRGGSRLFAGFRQGLDKLFTVTLENIDYPTKQRLQLRCMQLFATYCQEQMQAYISSKAYKHNPSAELQQRLQEAHYLQYQAKQLQHYSADNPSVAHIEIAINLYIQLIVSIQFAHERLFRLSTSVNFASDLKRLLALHELLLPQLNRLAISDTEDTTIVITPMDEANYAKGRALLALITAKESLIVTDSTERSPFFWGNSRDLPVFKDFSETKRFAHRYAEGVLGLGPIPSVHTMNPSAASDDVLGIKTLTPIDARIALASQMAVFVSNGWSPDSMSQHTSTTLSSASTTATLSSQIGQAIVLAAQAAAAYNSDPAYVKQYTSVLLQAANFVVDTYAELVGFNEQRKLSNLHGKDRILNPLLNAVSQVLFQQYQNSDISAHDACALAVMSVAAKVGVNTTPSSTTHLKLASSSTTSSLDIPQTTSTHALKTAILALVWYFSDILDFGDTAQLVRLLQRAIEATAHLFPQEQQIILRLQAALVSYTKDQYPTGITNLQHHSLLGHITAALFSVEFAHQPGVRLEVVQRYEQALKQAVTAVAISGPRLVDSTLDSQVDAVLKHASETQQVFAQSHQGAMHENGKTQSYDLDTQTRSDELIFFPHTVAELTVAGRLDRLKTLGDDLAGSPLLSDSDIETPAWTNDHFDSVNTTPADKRVSSPNTFLTQLQAEINAALKPGFIDQVWQRVSFSQETEGLHQVPVLRVSGPHGSYYSEGHPSDPDTTTVNLMRSDQQKLPCLRPRGSDSESD